MAALLILRNGGDVIGRCDALCYDAKQKVCTCVCEGVCHGLGLDGALAAVRGLQDQTGRGVYELTLEAKTETLFNLEAA